MKKVIQNIKTWVSRIPPRHRGGKLLRNVVCILLLLCVIWFCCDAPALSPRHAFRRMERVFMLEPAEILAVVPKGELEIRAQEPWVRGNPPDDNFFRTQLSWIHAYVVGEWEDTLTLFCWERLGGFVEWKPTASVRFVKKQGPVTVVEDMSALDNDWEMVGGVYLVHTDLPGARRVSLEVRTLQPRLGEERVKYTNWCNGTASVQGDGVFIVPVFQAAAGEPAFEKTGGSADQYEAHIVITDAAGKIIYDETLIVEEEVR